MKEKKRYSLLMFLLLALFIIDYQFLDDALEKFVKDYEYGLVERVIDGDTIVIANESVRLLGINTPERGEKYYLEAKQFLENNILNKTVKIEYGSKKYDLYQRKLAYIFLRDKNINVEIVKMGFANLYILDSHEYDFELKNGWLECLAKNINLCEKSQDICSNCINLAEISIEDQKVVFSNNCSFSCNLTNWEVKDEGRKEFIFPGFNLEPKKEVSILLGNKTSTLNTLYWEAEDYVWTKSGDTLFLRDSLGKLVLWEEVSF